MHLTPRAAILELGDGFYDRVVVFHEGEVTGILETGETSQEEIMQYASGVRHMFR